MAMTWGRFWWVWELRYEIGIVASLLLAWRTWTEGSIWLPIWFLALAYFLYREQQNEEAMEHLRRVLRRAHKRVFNPEID